jgi:hypothetical protein
MDKIQPDSLSWQYSDIMSCVVTRVVLLHDAQHAVILAGHVVRVVAKRGASMILVWEN